MVFWAKTIVIRPCGFNEPVKTRFAFSTDKFLQNFDAKWSVFATWFAIILTVCSYKWSRYTKHLATLFRTHFQCVSLTGIAPKVVTHPPATPTGDEPPMTSQQFASRRPYRPPKYTKQCCCDSRQLTSACAVSQHSILRRFKVMRPRPSAKIRLSFSSKCVEFETKGFDVKV